MYVVGGMLELSYHILTEENIAESLYRLQLREEILKRGGDFSASRAPLASVPFCIAVVCVVFTLNRFFYSTSPHPLSFLIHPREIPVRIMRSQTETQEKKHFAKRAYGCAAGC